MSSDRIQPERKWHDERRPSTPELVGRAWVKRDLDFWHPCTIEGYTSTGVTVAMDNMDELTVGFDDVAQFEIEPGQLVFRHHWEGSLSGDAAFVVSIQNESLEIEYPACFYDRSRPGVCLTRELLLYHDLAPIEWAIGTRVFAYKLVYFNPALFLFFPGHVRETYADPCALIEFMDGGTACVPATLIEKADVKAGDTVYACTSYTDQIVQSTDWWSPCRVLQRIGESLLLQDGAGEQFETRIELIAILPKGYQMFDGKFERIPDAATQPTTANPPELRGYGEVHIVRTDRWEDAAADPITRDDVAALVINDPELNWAPEPFEAMTNDRIAMRSVSITWRGEACFVWHANEIRCKAPNEAELAKIIEMAMELDANVVGHDGEQIH